MEGDKQRGRLVELVIDGDICTIKASGGHGSHAFHSDLIVSKGEGGRLKCDCEQEMHYDL